MKRIVLVEDNRIARTHFEHLIQKDGRYELAAVFSDAFAAQPFCTRQNADLVLMDVQTDHNHSGLAAGRRIKETDPAVKVLVVTSLIDEKVLSQAKGGCADSLWYKDHGDADILDVLGRTLQGERIFPDNPPDVELKQMRSAQITPRQMEVLRCFIQGMTYEEIAKKLNMTKRGVRYNISLVVEKGGFASKHELMTALIDKKLIVTVLQDHQEE